MEYDSSELAGYSFSCLDGCAMCCLCQPELSLSELERFRKRGLSAGLTKNHIQGYTTDEPTAIKLQGGNGACHFLKGRKCTIYDSRPAFCRQFPVHIHALHRVQLNANLSCRGIVPGGDSLLDFGNGVLRAIDPETMAGALSLAEASTALFIRESKEAGVHSTPERLRELGQAALPVIRDRGGIGRLLAYADSEPKLGDAPAGHAALDMASAKVPEDLEETARLGNLEQLDLENPAWQPVYVDERFRWLTYRARGNSIEVEELAENGKLDCIATLRAEEVNLLQPDSGALGVFGEYAALLNSRDPFLGYSYWLCREEEYAHDLATVYLGAIATTMLDLWWRSCLVGRILGRDNLDARLALEGIRAFDMDCLDMPTIGTFF